jgi:hypothetical protein
MRHHYIWEMRECGEVDVLFVRSEKKSSDIITKNVPEKLLTLHGKDIRDGKLRCRTEWNEIIEAIESTGQLINHIYREDVELWIKQQTDKDICSELSMNVRDEYMTNRDSFNISEPRLELCYV